MKNKIIVKGPALSSSGYGEQTRFALRALRKYENIFDIYLVNLNWGRTGHVIDQNEEIQWIKGLLNKTGQHVAQHNNSPHFDMSLQITIPNEFEKMSPVNIGYTAGIETTKVSPQWLDKANLMDKIVVISKHSKEVFEQTLYNAKNNQTGQAVQLKLNVPIEYCNYGVRDIQKKDIDIDFKTSFNFLSVAQWGVRKNIEATVTNFLKEFHADEDVGLIVKTSIAKNSRMDREACKSKINNLIKNTSSLIKQDIKCKIYLLHGSLNESEMFSLYTHPKIKALITTTHGEGFGLPIFEAAYNGLPVIAPKWSGQIDFLYAPKKDKDTGLIKNKSHFAKIDYDLKTVPPEAVWDGVIQADSSWCVVKDYSVMSNMRDVYKAYPGHLKQAQLLKQHLITEFEESKQLDKFVSCVLGQKKFEWYKKMMDAQVYD
jgi:glycosyltransferase involved in cell wall biosynthesis